MNSEKTLLYESLFSDNQKRRVEYGNAHASFDFFMRQNIPQVALILEIGCNIGTLSHKVHEAGYSKLQAVDIAPSAIAFGKHTYPHIAPSLQVYDGEKLPFEDNSFDIVMSFDVLEHIPDVNQHLQEVKRVMKSNGRYLFQTPNKLCNIPWEVINQRSLTKWRQYHCSLHTYWQLKRRLIENDFELISLSKQSLVNTYNTDKVTRVFGRLGLPLLHVCERLPIQVTPNFWVVTKVTK